MSEEKKIRTYDDIDDPWAFVIEASQRYKREFRKTSKIGTPPKVDDIIEKTLLGVEEEEIEGVQVEQKEEESA